jgi:hypothetical protein
MQLNCGSRASSCAVFTVLSAFTLPVAAGNFNIGDHVDARLNGQWFPCTVFKPEPNWLVPNSKDLRGYTVTCVTDAGNGPQEVFVGLADVRSRATTPEDNQAEAETAAALARQPKGNGVGVQYGTRNPRTCASRSAPRMGAPSAAQAAQYVICELEQGDGTHPLSLVANVKVEVAAVSHASNNFTREITAADIDPSQPVWDIRGSFTNYRCAPLNSLIAGNDFARTHNCWVLDQPIATGYCYKNTFGDWHCGLLGKRTDWQMNVLPPAGE